MENKTKFKSFQYILPQQRSSEGFTLIELLVVIAIIALLASVVLVSLNSSRQRARDAKRVGEINQIAKAMELYFNTNFSYPTTTGVAVGTFGPLSSGAAPCVSGKAGCVNYLVPGYLVSLPKSPTPADVSSVYDCSQSYLGGGGIANDYQIAGTGVSNPNTVNNYTMTFCLGNTTGSFGPGVHTLTQGGVK